MGLRAIRGSLVRIDDLDRRMVALAVPALGALLTEPLYNLTDSAIVGHLGRAPLGALAIATGALDVAWWIAAFIEMSTVTSVAQLWAARDTERARRGVGAAYVMSIAVGAFCAVLILALASPLTALLGGKGLVARDAVTYLRISAIGMVPVVMTFAGTGHLTGLGNTKRPFAIVLVANGINIVLEVVLVYVVHLGIAGSAWGTVAAQFAGAGLFSASSLRSPVRPARPRRSDLARLARDGVPLTIRTVALGLAFLYSTAIAARLSEAILAGHQIAIQIWLLMALALDALAVPAQVFVSQAIGAGDSAGAMDVGRRTLRFGFLVGLGLGIATVGLAGVLPAAFTDDPGVRHQATLALIVCGCQQPVAALAFVLDGLLLGASQYRILRTAMLVALLCFVPLAALALRLRWLGIVGVWLALTCWLLVRTGILLHRWLTRAWEARAAV
jgi:putative MATE family efflux protein